MNPGPGTGAQGPQDGEQTVLGPRKNRAAVSASGKSPKAQEAKPRAAVITEATGATEAAETTKLRSRAAKPAKHENERRSQAGSDSPLASSPRARSPWLAELWDWGRTLIIAVVIVFGLHYFVFSLSTVKGHSMEPTLAENEWLFVNKISYRFDSPAAGDVVIVKDPTEGEAHKDYLVKRIVAVPGDRIEIRQGKLYRNGELMLEPYTDVLIEGDDYGPETIMADRYFIMGDNRHAGASRDSRVFQAVPRSAILGRADLILWPITQWARL